MKNDIDSFSKLYLDWLKASISEEKLRDNVSRITLPYLDRNNDHIEVYIINQNNGKYIIMDDSNTISELELSGFNITGKRTEILYTILNSHGVSIDDNNALYVECTLDNLPVRKHLLVQCMLKVSDMFMLSKNNVKSIFLEDVTSFLDEIDVRRSSNKGIIGKSGLTNTFDFIISASKKYPERLLNTCNNLDLNQAKSTIFTWNDIQLSCDKNTRFLLFVNNQDKKPSVHAVTALKQYNIDVLFWSDRLKYKELLSA